VVSVLNYMKRRSFFKRFALGVAALATPSLTSLEAKTAAYEIPTPRLPFKCKKAFVTTVKGPVVDVCHGLNVAFVSVVACDSKGALRMPRVETLNVNTVRLTFVEPSFFHKRRVYKIVVGSLIGVEPLMPAHATGIKYAVDL
jgi:hypothetical protein